MRQFDLLIPYAGRAAMGNREVGRILAAPAPPFPIAGR
jgi:hypothetical protein